MSKSGKRLKGKFKKLYRRLPEAIRKYLDNKYAVASAILLVIIFIVVLIVLTPKRDDTKAEEATVGGDKVIYIIDEMGNRVAVSSEEDDELVMQNQIETSKEDPTILAYNANTREGYMNNCIFLGDSRTVAMVSYGYISDENALAKIGIAHTAVESTTFTQNSGSRYTLSDYLKARKEQVIYVCYGVNGMNGISHEKYESTYTKLVDKIISLAGERNVVLMSIWPVDDNGRYRNTVKNEWIDYYNDFLYRLAVEKGIYYLDVSSVLKDENGGMKSEYDSGDGLHYSSSSYKYILDYIIHHPVPGVSDEGDFVVHYVKPQGEYKDIMTEDAVMPQTSFTLDMVFPTVVPTQIPEVTEKVTPTPEITPAVTEVPEATAIPTPVITAVVTPTPKPTPEVTSLPEPTEEVTPTPEPTPEVTSAPEATSLPEETKEESIEQETSAEVPSGE
ncbi:MAG: hypothetical protein K6E98_12320 [Lachnospiraceae bacterium]|nr:hypothetical protein [Lachnospiraceae bacterium]